MTNFQPGDPVSLTDIIDTMNHGLLVEDPDGAPYPHHLQTVIAEMAEEIAELRQVVQFADGLTVSNALQHSQYVHCLADLYNPTSSKAAVLRRAGCHPRGTFRPYNEDNA